MAVIDDVSSEFDVQRQRAAQQQAGATQARRDAISRKFATLGGGPGGAQIAADQQAIQEGQNSLANVNEGINAQQNAEVRRLHEVQEGRQFQTSERQATEKYGTGEREAGQQFAAGQGDIQRKYGTSERVAGQQFASGQADIGRKFQTGERIGAQDYAAAQNKLGRDQQTSEFEKQLAQANDEFTKKYQMSADQFEHEKYIDDKNIELSNRIQKSNENQPGLVGGVFKDIGGLFSGGGKSISSPRFG